MKKKVSKWLLYGFIAFWASYLSSFSIACVIRKRFDFRYLFAKETLLIFLLLFLACGLGGLVYYYRHYWLLNGKNLMKGKAGDLHFEGNLESAHFQSDAEMEKNYETLDWDELPDREMVGTPIKAIEKDGHLKITFAKPAHSLVIGTTGSGKTSTFVSPCIQILSRLKNHPSLFISDPKGELYATHSQFLKDQGYEVKVLDLRNPYGSVRWNPLERPYLLYQRAIHLSDEAEEDPEKGCYLFDGKEYWSKEERDSAIQVKKQELLDSVYEDLNDICTVLCPITNRQEPMWESGAKNFILSIALAMLEDSADPRLGMTKEKYNFYSLMKVATTTDNDCQDLIEYFRHRSPLSKAVSLSRQVMDTSDKTKGSYLSSAFDKISMFADQSLCALTSENEIEFGSMGEKPIALFLQIPDEKETRHTLASMVILQAYKELVHEANQSPNLTLARPVYFLLDEFGNLPKIHKLEQMITVGRSRNIWLNLIVQSYSQLAKTYDEKSADIIQSNCNIQVFIGTTDLKTIEDFSKRCGNYSIVQRSVGFASQKAEEISSNSSVKERPLIYPSELQTLNKPGDMGHAIVTVFGYPPIKSTFTPCFLAKQYQLGHAEHKDLEGRYFDEEKAFYDMKYRNTITNGSKEQPAKDPDKARKEILRANLIAEQIAKIAEEGTKGILSEQEKDELIHSIKEGDGKSALALLGMAKKRAEEKKDDYRLSHIEDARSRLFRFLYEEQRQKKPL